MRYLIGGVIGGLIYMLPATAIYLFFGFKWAALFWLIVMFLNIVNVIFKEEKK